MLASSSLVVLPNSAPIIRPRRNSENISLQSQKENLVPHEIPENTSNHCEPKKNRNVPKLEKLPKLEKIEFKKQVTPNSVVPTTIPKSKRDLEGYLFKKRRRRGYCGFWMVLDINFKKIRCFEDSTRSLEVLVLDLTEVKTVESSRVRGNPGFVIENINSKIWKIYSHSSEARDEWLAAIHDTLEGGASGQSLLGRIVMGLLVSIRSEQHPPSLVMLDYERSVTHNIRRPGIATIYLEEFAPAIFADIRAHFGVNQTELLAAWDLSPHLLKLSTIEVEKSSHQFLISNDKRFITKFIDPQEKKSVLSSICAYHQQVAANPLSLMMHIYGLYQYQSTNNNNNRCFMMINNWRTAQSPRVGSGGITEIVPEEEDEEDYGKVLYSTRVFWNIQTGDLGHSTNFRKIFGTSLEDIVGDQVPPFVVSAVNRLLADSQGDTFNAHIIFPRDPEEVSCLGINRSVVENGILKIEDVPDVRIVAGLLMSYFKELPQPLVPAKMFLQMLEAQEIEDPNWQQCTFHSLLLQLDTASRALLEYMSNSIYVLSAANFNKKHGQNALSHICACFGHLLLHPITIKGPPGIKTKGISVGGLEKAPSIQKKNNNKSTNSETKSKSPRDSISSQPLEEGEDLKNRSQCTTLLKYLILQRSILFQNDSSEASFKDLRDGYRVISSATLPKIIEKLVDGYYEDSEFSKILFTCHDYFVSADHLLDHLLAIFNTFTEDNLKDWQLHKRQRILSLLKDWLHIPGASEFWTSTFIEKVNNFVNETKFSPKEKIIVSTISRLLISHTEIQEAADPLPIPLPKEKQLEITRTILEGSVSAKQLASELSVLDYELFSRITTKECLHKTFLDAKLATNFKASVDQNNKFDLWIQTCILQQWDLPKRVSILVFFIELGSELLKIGNFASSMAIFQALNSAAIARLELTWDEIPKKSIRQLDYLKEIFCLNKNYRIYRQELSRQQNAIPYLGIISKDLFAIEEGNQDALDNQLINFTKVRLIYAQLKSMHYFQKIPSCPFVSKDKTLLAYLANLEPCCSEELYRLSYEAEPKIT